MKYLIVGNGGREHSILKKLFNENDEYYYTSNQNYNNYGMDKYATKLNSMSIFTDAKKLKIDMAIIGSEVYLKDDWTKYFNDIGIKCIGPTKNLAQIETSKSYARKLMSKFGLENYSPKYKVFTANSNEYLDFIKELDYNYVIKADGLHSGKGVRVSGNDLNSLEEVIEFCRGLNGEKIVVEEKLYGKEFSLMTMTDGITSKHLPLVQDFKRAFNNNEGPNTGSMGSISYENYSLPFLDDNDIIVCHKINESIIRYLYEETGEYYRGVLYGSYMKTENGIKVIEFNARFGDPECINVLSILETSLSSIFDAIVNQSLDKIDITYKKMATCCRYFAPIGYPTKPIKNHEIYIDNKINQNNIIYANMSYKIENDETYYYELGSRTLAIIGMGDCLEDATKEVVRNSQYISGPLYSRTDIGNKLSMSKYEDAGVSINEGNKVVKEIQKYIEATFNDNVISKFGDFAGLYQINDEQVLVSSTDGVGTKSILVLEEYGYEEGYKMLGNDLVNHCVNDILVKGARPLFFLDYYASSKIKSEYVKYFVQGLSEACQRVGCVLIGGETAEMPDVYQEGMCDIAGTIVGVIEKNKIIDGFTQIKEGNLIIGLPSSGPHTNGYSLIRKLVDNTTPKHIIDKLCASHKCYYHDIMEMYNNGIKITGLCHLTGGGWIDNPKRILPDGLVMDLEEIEMTECFKYLKEKGNIDNNEMRRTFNCGIGMLVFIENDGKEYVDIVGRVVNK